MRLWPSQQRAQKFNILPPDTSYFAVCDRHTLLKKLPKGGIGCEIGVFAGDNARFLRNELHPEKLYLIDPWVLGDWNDVLTGRDYSVGMPLSPETVEAYRVHLKILDPDYDCDNPNPVFEKLFQSVKTHFAGDRRVEIIRKKSLDACNQFADRLFDFVYIDGDHSFDAVYNDLIAYERKLKPGGVIIGNDYLCSTKAIHSHYGVVPAVSQFCKLYGFKVIALCHGEYADFVLAKSESAYVRQFLRDLVHSDVPLIALPSALMANYRSNYIRAPDSDAERFIPTF